MLFQNRNAGRAGIISGGVVTEMLNVTENTVGEWFEPEGLHRAFQVVITGTATVALQVSLDGVTPVTIRTSTASEAFSTAEPWPFMRFVSSGMSGATAKAYGAE